MHRLRLPSVAQITFVGVEHHEAIVLIKQAETLRGLAFVLVHLGQSVREAERLVEYGMIERNLDQFLLREDLVHLPPERCVEAVIVVNMQESTIFQVVAHPERFAFREAHIPVTGQVQIRKRIQVVRTEFDHLFPGRHVDQRLLTHEGQQFR